MSAGQGHGAHVGAPRPLGDPRPDLQGSPIVRGGRMIAVDEEGEQ